MQPPVTSRAFVTLISLRRYVSTDGRCSRRTLHGTQCQRITLDEDRFAISINQDMTVCFHDPYRGALQAIALR